MKIFLVIGSSGSYSDHAEWPVKAFMNEDRAKAFVESLPKVWEDLRAVRPGDHEEAQRMLEQWVASYKSRNPDESMSDFPDWLKTPNLERAALMRASNEMREHAPGYNGDDTEWSVSEIELVE